MKQPPCRCGYLAFPHRHSHWCDAWLAQQEDEDSVYEWDGRTAEDNRLDDPRHGQAAAINRENAR